VKGRWPAPRIEVRCDECKKPLQRAAAVRVNGKFLHAGPRCFGAAMAKQRAQLDLLLESLKL
jgi:hypothetical protein